MQLPKTTLELLKDEAYVSICRRAIEDRIEVLDRETEQIVASRPAFGILAPRRTREAFHTSLRVATHTDAALRERLVRFAHVETWLRSCLQEDLTKYLTDASSDYQRLIRVQQLLGEWEQSIVRLPDLLVGFARDLRGLRLAAEKANPDQPAGEQELESLRQIAVQLENAQRQADRTAAELARHSVEMAAPEIRMPTLPTFRRTVWVEWLCVIPLDQAVAEVARVEYEVRAFLNSGLQLVRSKLHAARSWCRVTQEGFLNYYWNQLREHARAHFVGDCDADHVLNRLMARYELEMTQRQRRGVPDPYGMER